MGLIEEIQGMFLHESEGEYGLSQFKNLHPNDLWKYENGEYVKLTPVNKVWHSRKEIDEIIKELAV